MSCIDITDPTLALVGLPDRTDLLIRSTSSLLHLVRPQLPNRQRRREVARGKPEAAQLDRFALLLVDPQLKSQAAAATAILSADSIDIYNIASDIHVAKNSSESSPEGGGVAGVSNAKNKIAATPSADWMTACLSEGPFGAERHAVQLEYLIGEYTRSPAEAKVEAHTNLTRYIYFHCLPKLQQRLKHHVALDRQVSFLDILCNRKILDLGDISSGYCPPKEAPPFKLQTRDESWLYQFLRHALPNYEISLAGKTPGGSSPEIAHVAQDVASSRATFYFLRLILESIVTQVGIIDKLRAQRQPEIGKEDQENNLRKLKKALDSLINKMEIVSLLARHSVSVWHLLGQKTVSNAFKYHPNEKKSTGLSALGSFADGEDDCDTYNDASDVPGYEPGVRGAIIQWLKYFTQWQDAVEHLRSGTLGELVSSRTLRIHVIRTSPPSNPTMQASLEETLQAMYENGESPLDLVAKARLTLVEIARRNLRSIGSSEIGGMDNIEAGYNPSGDYIRALSFATVCQKWRALACADEGGNWRGLFSGAIHCEGTLACEMEIQGSDSTSKVKDGFRTLGVSRPCCYACHVFLQELNPKLNYTSTQGKVYPWALPNYDVPANVKQEVLKDLQYQLRSFFYGHDPRDIGVSDGLLEDTYPIRTPSFEKEHGHGVVPQNRTRNALRILAEKVLKVFYGWQ